MLILQFKSRWLARIGCVSAVALALGSFAPVSSVAQGVPEAEQVLKDWFDSQRAQWDLVDEMSFNEQVNLSIDGAFAKRKAVATSIVKGVPRDRKWDRKVVNARINGRRANGQQYERIVRTFWRTANDNEQNDLMSVRAFAPRFVSGLQPENVTMVDRENGGSAYRFDLRPKRRSSPIERVTLWFDADTRNLIRSKVLLSPQNGAANMVVTTGYERQQGIDLPFRRTVEGNFKSRRRLREFTTLVDYKARYSDFVIDRQDR